MLMVFDPSVLISEFELPDKMTTEEYDLWYEASYFDRTPVGTDFCGSRFGPRVLWVEDKP